MRTKFLMFILTLILFIGCSTEEANNSDIEKTSVEKTSVEKTKTAEENLLNENTENTILDLNYTQKQSNQSFSRIVNPPSDPTLYLLLKLNVNYTSNDYTFIKNEITNGSSCSTLPQFSDTSVPNVKLIKLYCETDTWLSVNIITEPYPNIVVNVIIPTVICVEYDPLVSESRKNEIRLDFYNDIYNITPIIKIEIGPCEFWFGNDCCKPVPLCTAVSNYSEIANDTAIQ